MFRYVIEYTENPFHLTNYETVFSELNKAQTYLNSAVWHIGAKCNAGTFVIKTITLQHKVNNKWENYNGS